MDTRDSINKLWSDPGFQDQFRNQVLARLEFKSECERTAASDLPKLGHGPTPEMVTAYWMYLQGCRTLLEPNILDCIDEAQEALEVASREEAMHLPVKKSDGKKTARRGVLLLPPDTHTDWLMLAFQVAGTKIIHRRALKARDRYLRLAEHPLPSRSLFDTELSDAIASWKKANPDTPPALETLVGTSAARTSVHELNCLQWQLEIVDIAHKPRGSYLSPRTAPKQLGYTTDLRHALLTCFETHGSRLARQRATAATLAVFGRPLLWPSKAKVAASAKSIINREQLRLSDTIKKQINDAFERARKVNRWRLEQIRKQ